MTKLRDHGLGDSVQDDVMLATMMVNMRRYLGLEAGFVRAQGIDIDAKVPDCAVLSAKVDGALYWKLRLHHLRHQSGVLMGGASLDLSVCGE
jgi:hypothetical protein